SDLRRSFSAHITRQFLGDNAVFSFCLFQKQCPSPMGALGLSTTLYSNLHCTGAISEYTKMVLYLALYYGRAYDLCAFGGDNSNYCTSKYKNCQCLLGS